MTVALMTALPFDAQAETCPTRQALDQIGSRWTVLVVNALAGGPRRYTELSRDVGGISAKMLTQTLRTLERDGLISRTVHAVVPPRVDYELTALGATLEEPIAALQAWASSHMPAVMASRAVYDERPVTSSS